MIEQREGKHVRGDHSRGKCRRFSALDGVPAADLARAMVVMREWLGLNRCEPTRFDCGMKGAEVVLFDCGSASITGPEGRPKRSQPRLAHARSFDHLVGASED